MRFSISLVMFVVVVTIILSCWSSLLSIFIFPQMQSFIAVSYSGCLYCLSCPSIRRCNRSWWAISCYSCRLYYSPVGCICRIFYLSADAIIHDGPLTCWCSVLPNLSADAIVHDGLSLVIFVVATMILSCWLSMLSVLSLIIFCCRYYCLVVFVVYSIYPHLSADANVHDGRYHGHGTSEGRGAKGAPEGEGRAARDKSKACTHGRYIPLYRNSRLTYRIRYWNWWMAYGPGVVPVLQSVHRPLASGLVLVAQYLALYVITCTRRTPIFRGRLSVGHTHLLVRGKILVTF